MFDNVKLKNISLDCFQFVDANGLITKFYIPKCTLLVQTHRQIRSLAFHLAQCAIRISCSLIQTTAVLCHTVHCCIAKDLTILNCHAIIIPTLLTTLMVPVLNKFINTLKENVIVQKQIETIVLLLYNLNLLKQSKQSYCDLKLLHLVMRE